MPLLAGNGIEVEALAKWQSTGRIAETPVLFALMHHGLIYYNRN